MVNNSRMTTDHDQYLAIEDVDAVALPKGS